LCDNLPSSVKIGAILSTTGKEVEIFSQNYSAYNKLRQENYQPPISKIFLLRPQLNNNQ
jgi:hypothetical protein